MSMSVRRAGRCVCLWSGRRLSLCPKMLILSLARRLQRDKVWVSVHDLLRDRALASPRDVSCGGRRHRRRRYLRSYRTIRALLYFTLPSPPLPPVLQDNKGPDTHAYLVNTWSRASQSKCVSQLLGRLEVCCVSELSGEGTCRRATCCGGFNSYSESHSS